MSIWELPKEHYNWESPITKIYGEIRNEIVRYDEENCIFSIEQAIGYKVDKEELVKALQYDREQYDKGYEDGAKETFVKELEKLKGEIVELEKKMGQGIFTVELASEIVNDYITELKGEAE